MYCAIDFGTSNLTIAIAIADNAGAMRLVELEARRRFGARSESRRSSKAALPSG